MTQQGLQGQKSISEFIFLRLLLDTEFLDN
jgi:hypothetical protein